MRCKKGQFYLVAAILIVILVAASAVIFNYSRKNSSTLYDLGQELGIEGRNIIDYGTTNQEDVDALFSSFIADYASYAGEGKKLYFIFGNTSESGLQIVVYDGTSLSQENFVLDESAPGKVSVEIESVVYQFDLSAGYNFYFVVSQEVGKEKHVVTG